MEASIGIGQDSHGSLHNSAFKGRLDVNSRRGTGCTSPTFGGIFSPPRGHPRFPIRLGEALPVSGFIAHSQPGGILGPVVKRRTYGDQVEGLDYLFHFELPIFLFPFYYATDQISLHHNIIVV